MTHYTNSTWQHFLKAAAKIPPNLPRVRASPTPLSAAQTPASSEVKVILWILWRELFNRCTDSGTETLILPGGGDGDAETDMHVCAACRTSVRAHEGLQAGRNTCVCLYVYVKFSCTILWAGDGMLVYLRMYVHTCIYGHIYHGHGHFSKAS